MNPMARYFSPLDILVQWLDILVQWLLTTDMATSLKQELRHRIASTLKALPDPEVAEQSRLVSEKVCALPEFARARGVSVYLEMPKEAATSKLLEAAFAAEKKVFVPKITGQLPDDLKMLQTQSMEDIRSFPKVDDYLDTSIQDEAIVGD